MKIMWIVKVIWYLYWWYHIFYKKAPVLMIITMQLLLIIIIAIVVMIWTRALLTFMTIADIIFFLPEHEASPANPK